MDDLGVPRFRKPPSDFQFSLTFSEPDAYGVYSSHPRVPFFWFSVVLQIMWWSWIGDLVREKHVASLHPVLSLHTRAGTIAHHWVKNSLSFGASLLGWEWGWVPLYFQISMPEVYDPSTCQVALPSEHMATYGTPKFDDLSWLSMIVPNKTTHWQVYHGIPHFQSHPRNLASPVHPCIPILFNEITFFRRWSMVVLTRTGGCCLADKQWAVPPQKRYGDMTEK